MIGTPTTVPAAGATGTGSIAAILQGTFELPAPTAEGGVSPEAAGFQALLAMLGLPAGEGEATPETATAGTDAPTSDTPEGDTGKESDAPFQSPEALAAALASGVAAVLALAAKPAETAKAPVATATATPAVAAAVPGTPAPVLPVALPEILPVALTAQPAKSADQSAKAEEAAPAPASVAPAIATLLKLFAKNHTPADTAQTAKAPADNATTPAPAPAAAQSDTPDAPAPLVAALAPADIASLAAVPLAAPLAPAPVDGTTQVSAPSFAPANGEVAIQHHLDLAHEGAWLDQLARDIARVAGNEGHLRFQLNPEHLGSLKVEVATATGGTSIRLTADSDAARSIIADAQPRLIAEARAQGLRISETHVDLGGQMAGQNPQRHFTSEDQQPFLRTNTVNVEGTAESPAAPSSAERYA